MKQRNSLNINALIAEYLPTEDIWTEAIKETLILRHIIRSLPQDEKNAILFYAECGSLRKLGKALGVSVGTVQKYISNIKKKVKNEYREKQRNLQQ